MDAVSKRPVLVRQQRIAVCILLLCISVLSGCSAIPMTTTTAQSQVPVQPAAVASPFPAATQTFDKDFNLTLDITPDRSGKNTFIMHIVDNHTNKPAIHVNVTLYTTMQDMPMGTNSIVLHENGNGQFSATSDLLSMSGHWAIGITVQTSDHAIHKAGVSFVLPL